MSSISKRPDGIWRARYRDDAGKEHAKHAKRKVDAQRWLDQQTAALVRGDHVDPKAGRTSVKTYAEQWQQIQVSSTGTKRIVDNALRLHVIPELGQHKIAAVRRSHIQALVKGLEAKGLAAGSVRNIYEVAAQVFAAAVDDRLIALSPCMKINLPRVDGAEVDVPSIEEVQDVRDALPVRWRPVITTLAGSGLRIGELLGLQVSDVDFLRRTIRVDKQRLQSGEVAPTKSRATRTVPVGQVVIDTLAAHLAENPNDGALISDEIGEPLRYGRWKKLLQNAGETAGVAVTSHSFRHFAASALISGGASVKQTQMFLGHASAVITLRTYAHLFPGDEDRTRNVLDAALGPIADCVRTEAASK